MCAQHHTYPNVIAADTSPANAAADAIAYRLSNDGTHTVSDYSPNHGSDCGADPCAHQRSNLRYRPGYVQAGYRHDRSPV